MKKVEIKGAIVSNNDSEIYEYFGMECCYPKKITQFLDDANGEDVIVEINSGGGSVFDATEIYSKLLTYKGNVEIHVVGFAGSAASYIATARKSMIYPGSMVMIHNASTVAYGDKREMQHVSDVLKEIDKTICGVYMRKTNKTETEILNLMSKETWMSADRAVELGFIDEVYQPQTQLNFYNSIGNSQILSPEVLEKTRIMLNETKENHLAKAKAKFNLLKLKGEN